MESTYIEKLIERICSDTENIFSCSPKVAAAKVIPNFILLLELVSLGTSFEERVNRILQSYYHSDQLREARADLSKEASKILFKGKTYGEQFGICEHTLSEMEIDTTSFWPGTLQTFIKGGPCANGVKLTDEFKLKFCRYLGLDVSVYLPSKGEYRDYLIHRQRELMKLLDVEPDIIPDFQYQGMTSDLKEALFQKFSAFIQKINNEAWEGRINKNRLCSETQDLTSELKEYQKITASSR